MKFLKSHGGAIVITVLVVVLSVVFGFHRSATAARADVEAAFYQGVDGSGYSIAADLTTRRNVCSNLAAVGARYMGEGELSALTSALSDPRWQGGPAAQYDANLDLGAAAEAVLLALEDAGLSGQDAKYVQGFRADLDAKADTISRDGYNALVDAFNTKVLGVFPANFLRHIAFVRGAEAFR